MYPQKTDLQSFPTPPHIHLRCSITPCETLFDQRVELIEARQVVLLSDGRPAAVTSRTATRIVAEDDLGHVMVFEADGPRAGMPVGN
ncbi:hypothetical protein JKG47_04295 [Acidithiobacillus sp. MC6.1]|nr:hypothetical protein [Acidithiobacillus sp. MC6.1]